MAQPTPTSYALLGLLELRPWTAYELVGQSRRSLRWFWPRSEAHLYAELKRLVQLGYADAERVRAGQRSRTRYSITEAGRKAMQAWLRTPPLPPLLEFQGLLRVLFADQGTVDDLQAALRATNEQARAMLEDEMDLIREALRTGGQFPERLNLSVSVAEFLDSYTRLIIDWTERTATEVAGWDSTQHRGLTRAERATLTNMLERNDAADRARSVGS
jgi:DNA-binding PadR family transcriptional regulator